MSLSGTFATMTLPDLLTWIGDSRRSGMLVVALEFEERYLTIRDGALVGIGSDDPRSRDLARFLLARKLVPEDALRRAIEAAERTHKPLRSVIEGPFVPADTLRAALRAHAKDSVLGLFMWHDGRFLFSDRVSILGDPQGEAIMVEPIPMREILMDGIRRIDEWKRIAEVLPSDYTLVHALGTAPDLPALDVLAQAGEPLALGDLCLRFARPRFEVLHELHEAWRRGLLAVDATPHELARPADTSPADMLVKTARTLLDERQWDEAAALLRSTLDLDPYHEEARKMLHRARWDQLEALYQELPPYRVPKRMGETPPPALSPRERYLWARIDGARDVGALTVMTPLGELETLRALKKMSHLGLIALHG